MTDVLSLLPRFSFRGIEVPIVGGRTAGFAHDDVKHKFSYQDNELVESMGASGWTFSYTFPMREDIARGPYKNLYTVVLPRLILACRDRSPGELVDPELGQFRAKPTQLTSEIDVNKRDGTELRVEFIHAPKADDEDLIQGGVLDLAGVQGDSGALDADVALQDWEQEEPPEPTLDPLTAIDGLGRQIEFAANRVSAKMDDAAFRCEKLEATIDKLENPQLWPLKRSARRLRNSIRLLAEHGANPERRIVTVFTNYDRTLLSIASEAGMTLQDLLALNPVLAKTPLVPKGSQVRRYANG